MIDLLLLLGVALCVISVLMAVVAVARTQAPRSAAVLLVLGIAVLFGASWFGDRALGVTDVGEAWQRVVSGESFASGTTTVTVPPAAATDGATDSQPAPQPAPAPAAPEAVPQTTPQTAPQTAPAAEVAPAPAAPAAEAASTAAPAEQPATSPEPAAPATESGSPAAAGDATAPAAAQ